ncbi:hypothetical protein CMK12_00435 [Candidatus Poribacteria bacterium]|nr:hypothetical protein [Candidatus Poribacteria bacterium]
MGWNFQPPFTLRWHIIGDEQYKLIRILIAQLGQKQTYTIGTQTGKNQKIAGPVNRTDYSISRGLFSNDWEFHYWSDSQGAPTPVGICDSAKALASSSRITCQGRPLFLTAVEVWFIRVGKLF